MTKILKITAITIITLLAGLFVYIQTQQVEDKPVSALTERWAQPPSVFVEVDGMQVHLRDEGPRDDVEPVVLLHGTSASLHTWDGWAEVLRQERRVIRFDLPAFGLTGPEPQENYTIERYVDVVVGVLDALGIERAVLAGNSLGGYIAWATAILHEERVSGLVLVDASGYPYEAESVPLAFKLSQNRFAKALLGDFLPRWLVSRSVRNVYGDPDEVSDALVDRYYQLTLREGNRAALTQRFVQTQPGPLAQRVSDINVPVLILWGAKDRLIPVKLAHKFNQDITDSELVIFEHLGHVPHEEDPEATVAPVQRFLRD